MGLIGISYSEFHATFVPSVVRMEDVYEEFRTDLMIKVKLACLRGRDSASQSGGEFGYWQIHDSDFGSWAKQAPQLSNFGL